MVGKISTLSAKRQARVAGALYLVVILAGMFAEVFVRPKILVGGDAAATAHNLASHLSLYRIGLLTDLLTVVAAVAEGVIVYWLFKPLSPTLALTSLLIALVSNAGEVVSGLIHLLPLIILHGGPASQTFPTDQWEELAQLTMRTHTGFLAITLAVFSFALCIDGYLVYVSTFVPKAIGVFLVIAGAFYLTDSVANLLDLPLGPLDAVLPIAGLKGRPRRRPKKLHADKGYDYARCRAALRRRGILARIAWREQDSSQRLGRHRRVVERTLFWLNRFRRLRVGYERRADIHQAFLTLGCVLICHNHLQRFC